MEKRQLNPEWSEVVHLPYSIVNMESQPSIEPVHVIVKALTFFSVAVMLSMLLMVMLFVSWHTSPPWHTNMEMAAMLLALMIGIVSLVHYYSDKTNIFLFIGTGFLGAGFLDGYHLLVTSVDFSLRLSTDWVALNAWSWIASRVFISLFLCFSAIASLTSVSKGKIREQAVSAAYVYCMAIVLALSSFAFFAFVPLPLSYYPYVLFHSPIEFIPAILFLVALVFYLVRGKWKSDAFEFWLILFLIVSVVLQACYISLSNHLFDTMFNMGHVLKVFSYVLMLTGLLVSVHNRFKFVVENSSKLKKYSKRLEESNQALEQFAYVASHDLREPLRKIGTFSNFLEEEYQSCFPEAAKDYMTRIRNAVGRMNAIIESLLNYSRITRKTMPFQWINLHEIVQTVISDLSASIKSTNAQIKILNELPNMDADAIQIYQVMLNLISNAIKFHKKNTFPIVTISARIIGSNRNSQCRISIKDNGIGFDEKYTDRIFGAFQRLHGQSEYEGLGIGLSVCKKIIERHEGEIKVRSTVGRGTIFTVILPRYQKNKENNE